jgi:hypothetical protein
VLAALPRARVATDVREKMGERRSARRARRRSFIEERIQDAENYGDGTALRIMMKGLEKWQCY